MRIKATFILWWIAWAIVQYTVLTNYGIEMTEAIVDSFICNVSLAASCLLIGHNMRYYLPGKEKYWYVLVISFALSCVWLLVIRVLLWTIFKDDKVYISML